MNCPNCSSLATVGADYCPSCGSTLPVECGSCGAANERASNFCFGCGSRLPEREPLPESPAPGPASAMCPRCRQSNEPGAAYCYSCGLPLPSPGVRPEGILSDRPDAPAFAIGRPAGFWIRLAAFIIDVLLVAGVSFIAWPLLSGQSLVEVRDALQFSEEMFIFTGDHIFNEVLKIAYFTAAVGIWATTTGKRIFNMYVVRTDGSKVGPGRALARYFAYQLSMLIFGVGFIMIGVRGDKRGLHDLICDTVVIIRQR